MADEKVSEFNPSFTDVNRRKFFVREVFKDQIPALEINRIQDDGELKRIMLLNKHDAKKLQSACELFLQTIFSAHYSNVPHSLSPQEMMELFGEADD